ncbi:hypothetical protein [Cognatiyoonia sp.]|uniref:hypothetical protein n=1 Tax=Cognatiyoonia sp. TaxID=2211652 RepID=UPI003F6A37F2
MRVLTGVLVCLVALPAVAQEFSPRDFDRLLSADDMALEVVGRTHEFFDGEVSFFSVSGTYSYTYSDGGRAFGSYALDDATEGVVCSSFENGFSQCDMYVHDGTRLVLIMEADDRFPVREVR